MFKGIQEDFVHKIQACGRRLTRDEKEEIERHALGFLFMEYTIPVAAQACMKRTPEWLEMQKRLWDELMTELRPDIAERLVAVKIEFFYAL